MDVKKSRTQAQLEKGKILEAWPNEDGKFALSVTPAVDIDRVKFSFFKKGQSGKGGCEIYVEGIVFYQLINELKMNRYTIPEKWEYRTGNNGAKQLSIEKGTKTYVYVHAYDGTKKEGNNKGISANVGLSKQQLVTMINLYDLFVKEKFVSLWNDSFVYGQEHSYKRDELSADDMESSIPTTDIETPDVATQPAQQPQQPTQPVEVNDNAEGCFVFTSGERKTQGNYVVMACEDENKNKINVCFSQDFIEADSMYEPLIKTLEKKGSCHFRAFGEITENANGKYLKVTKIATK